MKARENIAPKNSIYSTVSIPCVKADEHRDPSPSYFKCCQYMLGVLSRIQNFIGTDIDADTVKMIPSEAWLGLTDRLTTIPCLLFYFNR